MSLDRTRAAHGLRAASLELARLRRVRGASHRTWRRIARARRRIALASALLAVAAEPAAALDPVFRLGFRFHRSLADTFPGTNLADIDGDGDLDLLTRWSSSVRFVENTGTPEVPAFGPVRVGPPGLGDLGGATDAAPALVDIDADGDLDAFIGLSTGSILFFRNTGSATTPMFGERATNPFGLAHVGPHQVPALAFGDLDGDGDFDAFILEESIPGQPIYFIENSGSANAPAFAPALPNPFGLEYPASTSLSFVDIDGDDDLDAVIGHGSSAAFLENTGGATSPAFAPYVLNPFGLEDVGRYYHWPSFGDVDGDGDLDAVIGAYPCDSCFPGFLEAFENTGSARAPAFARRPAHPGDLGSPLPFGSRRTAPAFGDIDGDGDLDALVGDAAGQLRLSLNQGGPEAPAFPLFGFSSNAFGLANVGPDAVPRIADLDDDGDPDVLVGDGAGNFVFFSNTGSASEPAFAPAETNPFGLSDVGFHAAPDLADLDGDGDLDALVGRGNGGLSFFQNTGTASAPAFAGPSINPFGLANVGLLARPSVADADGDGDLDALVGNGDGVSVFFRNTGTASAPAFGAPSTGAFGLTDVGASAAPHLVDIDGDGDLDAYLGSYQSPSYNNPIHPVFFFENVAIDADACTDGLDNDGDGRIDLANDPGCASAADTSELGTKQCDNGLDDDGDGAADFRPSGGGDPQCTGPLDDREAPEPPPPSGGCGMGPELLLLLPLLAAERRRRSAAAR